VYWCARILGWTLLGTLVGFSVVMALNIVVDVRFYDRAGNLIWQESRLTGDATYFATGTSAEVEAGALDRAMTDTARRIVERTVENW
jgi:hypothetical protein